MRYVRFTRPEGPTYGLLTHDDRVQPLVGTPFGDYEPIGAPVDLDSIALLAPVAPGKIVCTGRNYADHIAELGLTPPSEPVAFFKPPSAVVGPDQPVVLPFESDDVQHEAELAIVIGRAARRITAAEAPRHILGYTCANDLTARDLQATDPHPGRAKGFDTFCPIGPWIETDLDPYAGLGVRCRVNGETRQDGNTADLVFGVHEIVAALSQFATLLPGDVILTGSPGGVSALNDGDVVEVEIDGLGTLRNPVVAER